MWKSGFAFAMMTTQNGLPLLIPWLSTVLTPKFKIALLNLQLIIPGTHRNSKQILLDENLHLRFQTVQFYLKLMSDE